MLAYPIETETPQTPLDIYCDALLFLLLECFPNVKSVPEILITSSLRGKLCYCAFLYI